MPEGDTVWLAARNLDRALAGKTLLHSDFRVPQLATTDLSGVTVERVQPYGKHLFFILGNEQVLHTHFRMDGSWHLYSTGKAWHGGPRWQVRVVLQTEDVAAIGYRLPVVEFMSDLEVQRLISNLGPDILAEDFDATVAISRMTTTNDRAIGETLLDQRVIAGLGLIYVTESLFFHRVSPWTPISDVNDLPGLIATARKLMGRNRHRLSQSTTGEEGAGRSHYVYERTQQPCRRCGTRIEMSWQGVEPHRRLAYWCPRCQTGPAPPPMSAVERRALRTEGRSKYRP